MKIAIILSRFNEAIGRALLKGAREGLRESGLGEQEIHLFEVPGAFEIPLAALTAARSRRYSGIICLGAVIRGETPHFDYVCEGATQGILQAQLQTGLPIAFGVLTTDTVEQAMARAKEGHENKGYECAKVVIEMIELVKRLKKPRA